jgi:hypothetical protein
MKKIMVLFTMVLFCLSGIAKDLGDSWVVTEKGKMDCKKVRLGYNKARIVEENGQKGIVAFNTITSFSQNGRLFTKLRVYADNKPTKQMAFMELVKTCGELSLYKLGYYQLGSDVPNAITYRYFLYKGTKMHLALNDNTLANICLHFGLNYDEM